MFWSIPVWGGVGGSSHKNKQCSGHKLLSCNSTQFWHLVIPRNGIIFHRLRAKSHKTVPQHTDARAHTYTHISGIGRRSVASYYLYFWPTGSRSEVPTTPSLGSINVLERLTKLKTPVYSLDFWFITKSIKGSEYNQMKRDIGWTLNKGALCSWSLRFSMVAHGRILHPFPAKSGSSPHPFLWVLMEASLPGCYWLNHWPLVTDELWAPLVSPPQKSASGTERFKPLFMVGSSGNQPLL